MLKVTIGDQVFDNVSTIRMVDDNTMNLRSKSDVPEQKPQDDWQSVYDCTMPDNYVNDNTVDVKGKTVTVEVVAGDTTATQTDTTSTETKTK